MPEVLLEKKKNLFTTVLWKNESEIIITPQQQQQQQEKRKRREEKRSKPVAYFCLLPLLEFYRRRCLCSSFLPWLVDSKVRISAASFVNFSWMQNFLFTPLLSAECDSLWSSNVFFLFVMCVVCMYVCASVMFSSWKDHLSWCGGLVCMSVTPILCTCDIPCMYVCMCFCNVFEVKGPLFLTWRFCLCLLLQSLEPVMCQAWLSIFWSERAVKGFWSGVMAMLSRGRSFVESFLGDSALNNLFGGKIADGGQMKGLERSSSGTRKWIKELSSLANVVVGHCAR